MIPAEGAFDCVRTLRVLSSLSMTPRNIPTRKTWIFNPEFAALGFLR
jgi:hypothetical protein